MWSASSCTPSASPAIRWSRSPAPRVYDAADDTYEICVPTQGASDMKNTLSGMIGLAPEKFRIRSIDVGGAFGVRNEVYPEFLAVMLAAKRTGKPVKWLGTRSETMSGDHHARAADLIGELALDRRGKFLALRVAVAGQSRRVCLERRPADQHGRGADQLGHEPLQGRRHPRPAPAGVHQHDADDGLSRRRPPQRRLSLGAAGRGGGGRDRDRSGRAPPPQRAPQGGVPAQDADRLVLRQRRSGAAARHRAARPRTGTASRRAARPPRRTASCAASGLRCSSSRRAAWARSRSRSASTPTASSPCMPTPARRGRGTRPCSRRWSPTSWAFPRTGSSCATTTSRSPSCSAPAASARAR